MITETFHYPSLETERLTLKILTLEYTTDVFHHFSDEEITRFMDIDPCKDLEEAEEIIQYHLDDVGCRWGIFTKANHEFAGTCGFHYIRKTDKTPIAEIGYDLAKRFWGKGFMREALQAIVDFGFSKMSLEVIDATVLEDNERSIKLLERIGFKRERELKNNEIYFYQKREQYIKG